MENFNSLKEIIKTFHIGIVYYENQSYWVRRNPITHNLFYLDEINELVKKPIRDLSQARPQIAAKNIKYLRDLITVVAKYKEGVRNNDDALKQFEVNCTHYFVKVTKEHSAIEHLKGKAEGAGSFIVTLYFLIDLDYELSVRADIVNRLEVGLQQEINGIEPENLSIYEPSKPVTVNYGVRVPGEMKWETWEKILEADTYASTDKIIPKVENETEVLGKVDYLMKPEYAAQKGETAINSFKEYLVDQTVYDILIKNYKNIDSPKEIILMVFALIKLEKLNTRILLLKPKQMSETLSQNFGKIGSRQQVESNYKTTKEAFNGDAVYHNERKNEIINTQNLISQLIKTT